MKLNIRQLYLYLVSVVSLVILMIGAIRLIDLGLKVYVLKEADRFDYYAEPKPARDGETLTEEQIKEEEKKQETIREEETMRQRKREIAGSVSMIVVGGAVYFFHQREIKKEKKA